MIQLKRDLWCKMSFAMDGNKQEEKWLAIKCKASKWAKANSAPPNGSP
jgi:hypothetical protein